MSVALNEGLCAIGANAFTDTAIEALFVPSTVAEMGSPLAAGTGLVYAGAEATFGVAAGSPHFSLGEAGGLYRSDAEGLHLVRMMDPVAASYEVRPSTVSIDAEAFAGHGRLERVTLPEGLRVIGAGAFRDCRRLERVTLPESIERIEAEAFLDSGLVELSIPRNVGHIGRLALVAHGSHHGKTAPTLRSIEVDARNERFFMSSGLLLERLSGDTLRVVLFNDSEEVVRVPEGVVSIAPYALNNARNVRELYLSDRITEVGTRGLAVNCHIDLIHVDLVEPIGGHALIELRFPRIDRSVQQIGLAFSLPDHVNVESLLEHYDNAVIQGCSYDALNDGGIGLYEQATRILDRLRDPIFLNQVNRSLCERILEQNIDEICADVARHDDRRTVDALVDLGFVNEGNVNRIIERVGAVQDAAMTGYLLEVKRQRFEQATFDFDL